MHGQLNSQNKKGMGGPLVGVLCSNSSYQLRIPAFKFKKEHFHKNSKYGNILKKCLSILSRLTPTKYFLSFRYQVILLTSDHLIANFVLVCHHHLTLCTEYMKTWRKKDSDSSFSKKINLSFNCLISYEILITYEWYKKWQRFLLYIFMLFFSICKIFYCSQIAVLSVCLSGAAGWSSWKLRSILALRSFFDYLSYRNKSYHFGIQNIWGPQWTKDVIRIPLFLGPRIRPSSLTVYYFPSEKRKVCLSACLSLLLYKTCGQKIASYYYYYNYTSSWLSISLPCSYCIFCERWVRGSCLCTTKGSAQHCCMDAAAARDQGIGLYSSESEAAPVFPQSQRLL